MDGCFSCEQSQRLDDLPPRERIFCDDLWRLAHGWSSLPGWLVLLPNRHVISLGELTSDEAAELGALLRSISLALQRVIGCERTYAMLSAEQPGFEHLHVHLVPRMSWFADEKGPAVFQFLNVPEADQVSPDERDRLSGLLGPVVEAGLAD